MHSWFHFSCYYYSESITQVSIFLYQAAAWAWAKPDRAWAVKEGPTCDLSEPEPYQAEP